MLCTGFLLQLEKQPHTSWLKQQKLILSQFCRTESQRKTLSGLQSLELPGKTVRLSSFCGHCLLSFFVLRTSALGGSQGREDFAVNEESSDPRAQVSCGRAVHVFSQSSSTSPFSFGQSSWAGGLWVLGFRGWSQLPSGKLVLIVLLVGHGDLSSSLL